MRGLLYVIILLILAGCGFSSSQPRVLDEAQRLIGTDPTAALSQLNSLDVSELAIESQGQSRPETNILHCQERLPIYAGFW